MRISLIILTFNRAEFVRRAVAHNLANANHPIDELIWVDNGSTDHVRDVMREHGPDVCVLNKTNLGVAKGYNRGFALATGDYILITGCDMLMPDGWLAAFRAYLIAIPNTGVACMFHPTRAAELGDRVLHASGLAYQACTPWGRRIVSRELLTKKIGYLREDFGLYGWEDVEWGERAARVCREENLLTYSIPGFVPKHLGTEGVRAHDGKDAADYHAFKRREAVDPAKKATLERCRALGHPYFNPYA
jgi:glycosyltransferase involved in cell wall biosynthesis